MKQPRIAIVHDWLYGGGAELVVEELHKMYPSAPIYTSYCSDEWRRRLDGKVVTGYLQQWPFAQLRKFLPILRQQWFKHLDFSEFDIVISSTGNGEAKFVRVKKPAVHICYCHTPTHFYWRKYTDYLKNPGFRPRWLARLGLRTLVNPLRKLDYKAAQGVDYFIANSSHIQKDIKRFYNKESVVIHPPVNVDSFRRGSKPTKRHDYITWGRHVPDKRFDIIIKACNKLQVPLTVIGSGPETTNLKKIAGPTITFLGRLNDQELVNQAQSARAFLFASEDDFGIAPVEALAAGTPVVAYKAGGAVDYIEEGLTGVFFSEQTVASLVKALQHFSSSSFNEKKIQAVAAKFSNQVFVTKIKALVDQVRPRSSS